MIGIRATVRRHRFLARSSASPSTAPRVPQTIRAPTNAMKTRLRFPWLRLLVAAAIAFAPVPAAAAAPVGAEHGMVVTAHELATKVGIDVLQRGGNAIDAAVAVGYALAVVYPAAGNLGGGGFMTLQLADGRKTFVDFREKAPLAATANMFLDSAGNVVRGASTLGHLAVGVPGTVAGLEYAREKYGTFPRAQLIAPALSFAKRGFVLNQGDIALFAVANTDFGDDAATAAIFLDRGKPFKAGDRLVQKDLANTLRLIAQLGTDAFYQGPIGDAIAAASAAGKGIITKADLQRYKVRELAPLECDYRGYHIVSAPPPSSGGAVICEMLNILEGYPLKDLGFHSAASVHYQIEAMRHAYFDRNNYLGDPDFVKNPLDRLLDKRYAKSVRASINPVKASLSRDLKSGTAPHEGINTTHYSIVDNKGNAVSVTYTLNNWFGARIVAARTGILLNDEMDDFTIKPGVPNLYGLVQGQANAIAPGKRPLSSMSPTIVSRDGKPVMLIGAAGGSRIISVVALCIVNVIDYGMNIQDAIDAPRFHQQWLPETTSIENAALSPEVRKSLIDMGHRLADAAPAGRATGILVGAPSLAGKPGGKERYYGAIDQRLGTGLAAGY
jgi:gamma-glutamyltranspeptidase/glutathione hydrolase